MEGSDSWQKDLGEGQKNYYYRTQGEFEYELVCYIFSRDRHFEAVD